MAVYIVSNKSFGDNVYKIGYSENPNRRVEQLWNTSVPTPFVTELICAGDRAVEESLHDYWKDNRINDSREFFRLDEEEFGRLISNVASVTVIHYASSKARKFLPSYKELCAFSDDDSENHLEHDTPCMEVSITFTDGDTVTYEELDHNEVQITDNAVWVYDGKYTHNTLRMFPLHTIESIVCSYAQTACVDKNGEGTIRMKLPESLDMSRMVNKYGD